MVQRGLSNTLYNLIGLHFAMAVNDNHYADESQQLSNNLIGAQLLQWV